MISVLQLGTIDYATGLKLQKKLVDLRKEGRISDVLLLLEHTRVITLGRNANAANDVSASGQAITLPSGQFSGLQWLAAAMNGSQTSQTFTVTYTDGTQSTFTQSISDWFTPQSYAGELQAAKLPYRDTYAGGRDSRTFYLYNYKFNLNNAKTVQSIRLPNNANVQIMAMTLVQ